MASRRAKRVPRRRRATVRHHRKNTRISSGTTRSPFQRAHQDLKDSVRKSKPVAICDGTINEMKDILVQYRKSLENFPTQLFKELATIKDILQLLNGGRDLYMRLDGPTFAIVLQLLLVDEDSRVSERGIFLAASSLYENTYPDKLKLIGRMLDILVKHFTNNTKNVRARSWLGLLLLEAHKKCEENHAKFQDLTENVRRKLGSMITDEKDELLKITCGKLISAMNSAGCALQHLWPVDTAKKVYKEFPVECLDKNWSMQFQNYLDKIDELTLPSTGHVYWAQDIKTVPSIISGNICQTFIFVDSTGLFIHIACEDHFDQVFEIPFRSIDTTTVQQNPLDAQPNMDKDHLIITLARGSCYFNAHPVSLERIRITMNTQAAELMNDITSLVNTRRIQKNISNGELVTSSSNNSYKISQPDSPVAPHTVFSANAGAAHAIEEVNCKPVDSATIEWKIQSRSNIQDGKLLKTVASSVLVPYDSLQDGLVNYESGNLSKSTVTAMDLSQVKNPSYHATRPTSLGKIKEPTRSADRNEMTAGLQIRLPTLRDSSKVAGDAPPATKTVTLETEQSVLSMKSSLKHMDQVPSSSTTRLSCFGTPSAEELLGDASQAAAEPTIQPSQPISSEERQSAVNINRSSTTKQKPSLKIKKPLEFPKSSATPSPPSDPEKSAKFNGIPNLKTVDKMSAALPLLKDTQNKAVKTELKFKKSTKIKISAPPGLKRLTRQTKGLQAATTNSTPKSRSAKRGAFRVKALKPDGLLPGESFPTGVVTDVQRDFDFDLPDSLGKPPAQTDLVAMRQSAEFGTQLSKILDEHFFNERVASQKLLLGDDYFEPTQDGYFSQKLDEERLESDTPESSFGATSNPRISKGGNQAINIANVILRVPEQQKEQTRAWRQGLVPQGVAGYELEFPVTSKSVEDKSIYEDDCSYLHPAENVPSASSDLILGKLLPYSEQQAGSSDRDSVGKRKAAEQFGMCTPKRTRRDELRFEEKDHTYPTSVSKRISEEVSSPKRIVYQQRKSNPILTPQIPQLRERVIEASTVLNSVIEKIPSLVQDDLVRKPTIIGFNENGARNQGGSSTSKASHSLTKVHKPQNTAIHPRNRTADTNIIRDSVDDKSHENSSVGYPNDTVDRPTQHMAPPVALQYGTNYSQSQDPKSFSGQGLQFQRPFGSQGSRVTDTGSPIPLNSVAGQHPTLNNIKRGLIMDGGDRDEEPYFEDCGSLLVFGERKTLPPTGSVFPPPRNPQIFSSNKEPGQSSPKQNQESKSTYTGHKRTMKGRYVEIATAKLVRPQPKPKNPFLERKPQTNLSDFARRLGGEQFSAKHAESAVPSAPQLRKSMHLSAEDPEKTLVQGEDECNGRENSSTDDMRSGRSASSLDQTPDSELDEIDTRTAEQVWWAALRPHYTGVIESLYQISNHLVLHLQTGHLAAQQILDDYNDGAVRLVEEVERHHHLGRSKLRQKFETTRRNLKAIHEKQLQLVTLLKGRSVTEFELDWEKQQTIVEREVNEGNSATSEV